MQALIKAQNCGMNARRFRTQLHNFTSFTPGRAAGPKFYDEDQVKQTFFRTSFFSSSRQRIKILKERAQVFQTKKQHIYM